MYYGTLGVVSADNLGSLALGGFKESCSANRMCRHCLATKEAARTQVLISKSVPVMIVTVQLSRMIGVHVYVWYDIA